MPRGDYAGRANAVLYEMFNTGSVNIGYPQDKFVLSALRAHLGLPVAPKSITAAADLWVDATPVVRLWAELTGLEAVPWAQAAGVSGAKLADALVGLARVPGVETDELIVIKAIIYGVPAVRVEQWAESRHVRTGRRLAEAMRLVLEAVVDMPADAPVSSETVTSSAMKILGDTERPFVKRLRALAALEVGKSLFVE